MDSITNKKENDLTSDIEFLDGAAKTFKELDESINYFMHPGEYHDPDEELE